MRHEKGFSLESGALDHSAILTYVKMVKISKIFDLRPVLQKHVARLPKADLII